MGPAATQTLSVTLTINGCRQARGVGAPAMRTAPEPDEPVPPGAEITSRRDLPEPVPYGVIRTRVGAIRNETAANDPFPFEYYVQRKHLGSVPWAAVVTQAAHPGAPRREAAFAPPEVTLDGIAARDVPATQAALLVENTRLYSDLCRSEALLAEGQRLSHTGSWYWNLSSGQVVWSDEHYRILGQDPGQAAPTFRSFLERVHPEDRPQVERNLHAAICRQAGFAFDFRVVLPGGAVKYLHGVGRPIVRDSGDLDGYIGATVDVTARKQAEDALRDAQADLARAARLVTMGELTALIAHEVTQPLTAIVTNADTCLSWLGNAAPDLDEVRRAAERIVRSGHRAKGVVESIRTMARKSQPEMIHFNINEAIREVLVLLDSELRRHNVALETHLSADLGPVIGNRVQLQQVVLNLAMNGIDAMRAVTDRPRVLRVSSSPDRSGDALIAVTDAGTGLDPERMSRIFDAFFTTKPEGMGMGLAISRSIIEAHGGLLWASPQLPHGSVFQFTVPTELSRAGGSGAARGD